MSDRIEIIKGTSLSIAVSLTDANGDPYILADGESLVFGVKSLCESDEYAIMKTVTSPTDGAYIFELKPDDTADMVSCEYEYDVSLISGIDFYKVIPASTFAVLRTVTKRGDCG